jgi:hypothetical protein
MAASLLGLPRRQRPVYLVDLHCYKPPEELRVKKEDVTRMGHASQVAAAGEVRRLERCAS